MAQIEAENLTYSYPDGFVALDDLNFRIDDGEFVCIVGHSGCGKSTLLRLISGLALPTSGELTIDGSPITGPGLDRAVVFQQYSLFSWKTAAKNVEYGLHQVDPVLTKTELAERSLEMLSRVGMADAANLYPFQLSGGMKQRVAIARAFILDSDTLLLDEPFGALDQHRRMQLQKMLLDLWESGEKRKTVVFVTHDIDEAILLADRIFFMQPGRIVKTFTIDFNRDRTSAALTADSRSTQIRKELLELFAAERIEEELYED